MCLGHTLQHVYAHARVRTRPAPRPRLMRLAFIFIVAQARKQLLSFPTWHGPPCHSRNLRERERERDCASTNVSTWGGGEKGGFLHFLHLSPQSLILGWEVLLGASSRHTVCHSGVAHLPLSGDAVGVGNSPLFSESPQVALPSMSRAP